MKRVISIILAAVMAFVMSVSAFAANADEAYYNKGFLSGSDGVYTFDITPCVPYMTAEQVSLWEKIKADFANSNRSCFIRFRNSVKSFDATVYSFEKSSFSKKYDIDNTYYYHYFSSKNSRIMSFAHYKEGYLSNDGLPASVSGSESVEAKDRLILNGVKDQPTVVFYSSLGVKPYTYFYYLTNIETLNFNDEVPAADYSLTVKYQYSDGEDISEPYTATVTAGDSYNVVSPEIAGYTPDIPIVSGTMPNEDLAVTVTYTANSVEYAPITVMYQFEDGAQAAEMFTGDFPVGYPFEISSPKIAGYAPDLSKISDVAMSGGRVYLVTYSAVSSDDDSGIGDDNGNNDGAFDDSTAVWGDYDFSDPFTFSMEKIVLFMDLLFNGYEFHDPFND